MRKLISLPSRAQQPFRERFSRASPVCGTKALNASTRSSEAAKTAHGRFSVFDAEPHTNTEKGSAREWHIVNLGWPEKSFAESYFASSRTDCDITTVPKPRL
jgi:hypothetical protein